MRCHSPLRRNLPQSAATSTFPGFSLPDEIASVRVDTFKKTYPDVNLNLPEGSLDAQQFLTAVASRNVPDVIYLSREDLSTYATRGAIEPLDECIETQGIDTSQYRTLAMNQVTLDGQVYGIPEFYSVIALILSDEAFADAGLSPSDFTTTNWDQLSQFNEQLTRVQNGKLTSESVLIPNSRSFFRSGSKPTAANFCQTTGARRCSIRPRQLRRSPIHWDFTTRPGDVKTFMAFRDTWDFFGADNELVADQLAAFPMEQWYFNVLAEASPDLQDNRESVFGSSRATPLPTRRGIPGRFRAAQKILGAACAFMKTMTAPATWLAGGQGQGQSSGPLTIRFLPASLPATASPTKRFLAKCINRVATGRLTTRSK